MPYLRIMEQSYEQHGDLYFNKRVPLALRGIIVTLYRRKEKVKIYYGDQVTGKAWPEEHGNIGYIGRSHGPIKIPLLLGTKHSSGGPELSSHIVAIRTVYGKKLVYQHPTFEPPKVEIREGSDKPGYAYEIYVDDKLHSRHPNYKDAEKYKNAIE